MVTSSASQGAAQRRPLWAALGIGVTISALLLTAVGAQATEHVFSRGIASACTAYAQQIGRFSDVDPDDTHAQAIDCLASWRVVLGRDTSDDEPIYAPGDQVTRAAMASYVARTLQRPPNPDTAVPEPSDDRFPDYASGVHADNVHLLRAAGIAEGRDDGTYGPSAVVTRAQMASYIARMIEFVTGEDIPVDERFEPAFPDTDGVHATNINKLATLGVVQGRTDGTYGPSAPVSRGAMASFVARGMDYLAFRGYLPVPFSIELDADVDPVPANLNHRITAQVLDQFGNDDDFGAEVRFEIYRDGTQVLTAPWIDPPAIGAPHRFSYNAGASAGDTDDVVACIIDADQTAPVDDRFCLDDAGDPVEGRHVAQLTVGWTAPVTATDAPDAGDLFGEAIEIDTATNTLWVQPAPPDDANLLYRLDYAEEANFVIGDETNVATAVFECAIEASIADERNRHSFNADRGPEIWNTYYVATGTDISGCFP